MNLYNSKMVPKNNLFEEFYGISVQRADQLNTLMESNAIEALNARCTCYITYRYATRKIDAAWNTVLGLLDAWDLTSLEIGDGACAEFMEEYRRQKRLKIEKRKAAQAGWRQSESSRW